MWFPRAVIFGVQALDTCCSSVVARGWVLYHWYVLKGGAIPREHDFAPFTVPNAPHLHTPR